MRARSVLVALAAVLALPAAAQAVPTLDGRFAVSGTPGRIAAGPDGNVWFTLGGTKELGRITPAGVVTEFDLPKIPTSLTAGPGNKLWLPYTGGVLEWDIASETPTEHPIAQINAAEGIVRDPMSGSFWVVDPSDGGLVEVSSAGAFVREVTVAGAAGRDITMGSDGRLWWADFGGQAVRATTTAAAPVTTPFAVGGGPQGIAASPDGLIAYSNPAPPQTVGRFTVAGAALGTTPAGADDPFGAAYGTDGAFWFAQFAGNSLLRLTPDGQATTLALPPATGPRRITAGPGNTLWVSLETTNEIARITGVEPEAPAAPPAPPPAAPNTPIVVMPVPGDTTAPRLTGLRVRPARFRVGRERRARTRADARTAQRRRRARRRPAPRGTTIRFTLSEPATVRFDVERARAGRRRGGSCVAPSRRLRRARRCTRWVRVGTLRRPRAAGTTEMPFSGRIAGRALAPGRYRLRAVAVDGAANTSRERRAGFRIVAR